MTDSISISQSLQSNNALYVENTAKTNAASHRNNNASNQGKDISYANECRQAISLFLNSLQEHFGPDLFEQMKGKFAELGLNEDNPVPLTDKIVNDTLTGFVQKQQSINNSATEIDANQALFDTSRTDSFINEYINTIIGLNSKIDKMSLSYKLSEKIIKEILKNLYDKECKKGPKEQLKK